MDRVKTFTVSNLLVAFLLAVAPLATLAQNKEAPPVKPVKPRLLDPMGTSEMVQKLSSDDAATRKQAIDAIKERLAAQPGRILDQRSMIFKALMTGKHYDEALDLAWFGIVSHPHDPRLLESLQQTRIKALLASGKTDEALQNAKSLFNTCSMSGTSEAILLVAECLNAARPKDKESFNKFREEQIAGAASPAPADATPASIAAAKGPRCTVLDSIKVDPKPYHELLATLHEENFQGLMARGNLHLMADEVAKAKEIFERMYSVASHGELLDASEALARCLRAEDGTIGRANAWIQSIRPKPAATTPTTSAPTTPPTTTPTTK